MSQVQDTTPASDTEPTASEPSRYPSCNSMAQARANLGIHSETRHGLDLGGHTLLSRSPTPKGRRSLFRS